MKNNNLDNINYNSLLKNINLNMLKYFVILAETKDFIIASQRLNITQQALSKAITNIENEIGIKIIERNNTPNDLTIAGNVLLSKVKSILEDFNDLKFISKKNKSNTLRIVFCCNHKRFRSILNDFIEKYPDVFLEIYFMFANSLDTYLNENNADVGFTQFKPKYKDLNYIKGSDDKFVIVSNKPNNFRDWNDLDYIGGQVLLKRDNSDEWDDSIYPRNISVRTNSLNAAIKMCEDGFGALYIQKNAVIDELENNKLFITSNPPFEKSYPIYLTWKNNNKSKLVKDFIEITKIHFEKES